MALKVKFRTQFPAHVVAASPIVMTKTGSRYDFSFDQSALLTSFAKTGTGTTLVLQTAPTINSPILTAPVLGVATATSINSITITAPASAATLTIPDGVTLTGPAASGTAMTLGNTETVTGVKTFGSAGAVGRLKVAGTTSGTTILDATAVASGTLIFPAATDTLIAKATTDILTNKTYDTAGTGNVFKINGTAISANTGTGSNVLATSPTITKPNLVGTATNDGAAVGSIGEMVVSNVALGSAVSLTTATTVNMSSISLTAGDWDVTFHAYFNPAGTTSVSMLTASISQTTNTQDSTTLGAIVQQRFNATVPGNLINVVCGPLRVSISGTTTIYAVSQAAFTVSTLSVYGQIRARRVW